MANRQKETKDKGGRPSKFSEDLVQRLVYLIGVRKRSIESACAIVNIHPATFYRWQESNPQFCELVKDAKEAVNDAVESHLLRLAAGYTLPGLKIQYDAEKKTFRTFKYDRHFPPSEGALKLWLMNQRRHEWGNDPENKARDVPIVLAYDPGKRFEKPVVPLAPKPTAIPAVIAKGVPTNEQKGRESGDEE